MLPSYRQPLLIRRLGRLRHSAVHPDGDLDLEALSGQPLRRRQNDAAVIARDLLQQVVERVLLAALPFLVRDSRCDEFDSEFPLQADPAGDEFRRGVGRDGGREGEFAREEGVLGKRGVRFLGDAVDARVRA